MTCCERCGTVYRWTFGPAAAGDGVEYLVETGHSVDRGRTTTEVVLTAPGLHEPR